MAIRPDYVTGTITLTSGSTSFTTSGSALQAAAVKAGDEIITRSGNVLIIASITGQNSGTLMQPCPAAAAGAAQPLRIRYQPDGSRYQGAARDLISRWGDSGSVDALAGITGAANTMPYFTGVGTMGRTPLTAFARSLLDDANAEAMLTTLGFSSFMRNNVGIASFFGWGLENVSNNLPNNDLNSLRTNGVWRVLPGAVGEPTSGIWQVLHMGQQQNYATQVIFPVSGLATRAPQIRTLEDNIWIDWRPLSSIGGSNANGVWLRLYDGTQICYTGSAGALDVSAAFGVGFRSSAQGSWTFPMSFYGVANVAVFASAQGGNRWASGYPQNSLVAGFRHFGFGSTSDLVDTRMLAIGRWY